MRLKARDLARIVFDYKRNTFAVMIGVTMPHFGTIDSCIGWCTDKQVTIANQAEVDRMKGNNPPTMEIFSMQ